MQKYLMTVRWTRPLVEDLDFILEDALTVVRRPASIQWEFNAELLNTIPAPSLQRALESQLAKEIREAQEAYGFLTQYRLLRVRFVPDWQNWNVDDGEHYHLFADFEFEAEGDAFSTPIDANLDFYHEMDAAVNGLAPDDTLSERPNAGACSLPQFWKVVSVKPRCTYPPTEADSAAIKRRLDTASVEEARRMVDCYPLEWDEWCQEYEAGLRSAATPMFLYA